MDILKQAAQALVDRWDTPLWKDAPHTGQYIDALRVALAQPQRKPLTEKQIELAYREIWRDLSDNFSYTSAEWIETGIRYAEKMHGIE